MGASGHYRDLSPGRGRHMVDPMRASTGTVQLGSSYDPYETSRRHYHHDEYPSDGKAYSRRSSRTSRLEAQPVSSHTFRDSDHTTKKRTEYTVRPRPRSNTASSTDMHDKPLRLVVPTSSHRRLSPVISSAGAHRSPSPLHPDSGRYLVPASSRDGGRHRRVYSTDYASDTGQQHYDNARRQAHHDTHRAHHTSSRRRHPAYDRLRKGEDIDDYDAYSYTTPREQFDRDYPVRTTQPASGHRMSRPVSMTGTEDPSQWLVRKEPRSRGPPPTYRGFDKLNREERPRSGLYGSDDARDAFRSKGGYHDQALVPVHHDSDDGYSSHHDDNRHRRPHQRSHHDSDRDRHHSDDGPSRTHNDGDERLMAGLGTLALGSGYTDVSDYDHRSTRPRHTRRDPKHGYDPVQSPSRELVDDVSPSPERRKQLGHDHELNRARRRSKHRAEREPDIYSSDEDLRNYRGEPSAAAYGKHSGPETSSESDRPTRDRSHRHRSYRSERRRDDDHSNDSRRSPSIDSKDEPRKPITVDPPVKEPDAPPPKGILKKPRVSFPEEPNPVREGIAPLKDAHRTGIPPGARWTKIDRRLVNPAALEANNERFEERADYVIVLRVLTREEIEKYAVKTQEIRGKHLSFKS